MLNGHQDMINDVAFMSHNRLVSCSYDKTMRVWDYQTEQYLQVFNVQSWVHGLALMTDNMVACGLQQGSINVWSFPDPDQ